MTAIAFDVPEKWYVAQGNGFKFPAFLLDMLKKLSLVTLSSVKSTNFRLTETLHNALWIHFCGASMHAFDCRVL